MAHIEEPCTLGRKTGSPLEQLLDFYWP